MKNCLVIVRYFKRETETFIYETETDSIVNIKSEIRTKVQSENDMMEVKDIRFKMNLSKISCH